MRQQLCSPVYDYIRPAVEKAAGGDQMIMMFLQFNFTDFIFNTVMLFIIIENSHVTSIVISFIFIGNLFFPEMLTIKIQQAPFLSMNTRAFAIAKCN